MMVVARQLISLVVVIVVMVEGQQGEQLVEQMEKVEKVEQASQTPPLVVDDRPRGERADGPVMRPRPPPRPGFGSFLSGLLGSMTQTASVESCPGKCIHALASLICDEVLEEVQCPSASMRCCVERDGPEKKKDGKNPISLGGLDFGLEA